MSTSRRYITKDGGGEFFDPHRAIFPIFAAQNDVAKLIGTGFFISVLGHFATAKHVFFAPDRRELGLFQTERIIPEPGLHACHFIEQVGEYERVVVRNITKISFSETSDVAIGAMEFLIDDDSQEPVTNKVPHFDLRDPVAGTPVHTYAYPNSSEYFEKESRDKIIADVHDGVIVNYSRNARDSTTITWPHIEMSFEGGGRTSGAPVFNNAGCVIGIYSRDGGGSSFACRAVDLLPLRVPRWPGSAEEDEPYLAQLIESGHIVSETRVQTYGDSWAVLAE